MTTLTSKFSLGQKVWYAAYKWALVALKAQGEPMDIPTEPGSYVGDIFFGDPNNSTHGTHRWDGEKWHSLPSDIETLTDLLASARAKIAKLEAAQGEAVAWDAYDAAMIDVIRRCVRDGQHRRQISAAPPRAPVVTDEMVERARRLYRALEMSADIMRDPKRTGGWEGSERTARAFEREAWFAKQLHDDLITAHPAPAVPEWQPIETAPRDGTHILVAKFDNGMGFGHSGPLNEHGFRDIQPWQDVVHWFYNGFYSSAYGVDQAEPFIDCTHWMPLPTPPKEAKGAVALKQEGGSHEP